MPAKSANLYVAQVDALEQLAKGDLKHTANGWVPTAHLQPVLGHPTIRSLAKRGLCRIVHPHGREMAHITRAGRNVWSAIDHARASIRSASLARLVG
jgi:hypothetical protein